MRLSATKQMNLDNRQLGPPGLSALWAEENTRESIFDALRRRETYATSGVRIRLRFFGGWRYAQDVMERADWIDTAYAQGVSMGRDLPPDSGTARAPTFVVRALKDPDSAHLDRIQIIKGWSDRGQNFEKVFDVAWSGDRDLDPTTHRVGDVGNTVNFADASYANTIGAAELAAVWTDPDFDPHLPAFYYVRVLEIPTPRWTLLQARERGEMPPDGIPMTVRERAWSSPIWFTPTENAVEAAPAGLTVAQLVDQGAEALDDRALIRLVVGKTVRVQNTVTGGRYDLFYGRNGRRLVTSIAAGTREATAGSHVQTFGAGSTASYDIANGRLVTSVGGQDIDIAVYRLDDRYYAARSNEFGFANYEIMEFED